MDSGSLPLARRLFCTPSPPTPKVARRLADPSSSPATPQVAQPCSPPPEVVARRRRFARSPLAQRRLFDDSPTSPAALPSPPPARIQRPRVRGPPLRQRFDAPPPRVYSNPDFEPISLKWNTKAITSYFNNYAPKYFR